jgi:phenylacetate-coenzyme A ligase PaaK-like adenylate-forming protein
MISPMFSYVTEVIRQKSIAKGSRAELERRRLAAFRRLVRHAQRNSPYYGGIIKDYGIDPASCLPTDFPVLTKSQLMEHFDDIVTDRRISRAGVADFFQRSRNPYDLYLGRFVALHTSGSSGEVGTFVFSVDDWVRGLAGGSRVYGIGGGRRRMAFYGATGGHYAGVSITTTSGEGFGKAFIKAAAFEINTPLAEAVEGLNRFRPDLLTGYVTGLKTLADEYRAGRLKIRPMLLSAGGEPMSRNDQQWLEGVFGCPCVNVYATTEHIFMGAARSQDPGMTLFDDNIIVEMAEDHILVTNLFNRTMPLIRYRMSDTLRPMDVASPFGPFPVCEPIVGRNEMLPVFRNAQGQTDFLCPIVIAEIFIPGVWRFQLRWLDETAFRFAVCLDSGLAAEGRAGAVRAMEDRLREIVTQKGLGNVRFTVEVVDDIPVDETTGKFRLIQSVGGH